MARRKHPPLPKSRKALLALYEQSYKQIPDKPKCARCGVARQKKEQDRHHVAGRRKSSFLFTVQLCFDCHRWVHSFPAEATRIGLLWPCRNSKIFTTADAVTLVHSMPCPPLYALDVYKRYQP